ncbi:hypothetical protein F2Q70_00037060 [Brassica cretica]|uniref:Uncharacterized protein n=1 Tax=Brassica cretica TaxID=69181 RepID=A0A8S9JVB4_BRACR|nr:hypothetical protein F2Q70_00037060 [Brassica cretica]
MRATSGCHSGQVDLGFGSNLEWSLWASGATWSGRSGSVFGFHRDEMASDFSGSLLRVALRGSLERPHGVAP